MLLDEFDGNINYPLSFCLVHNKNVCVQTLHKLCRKTSMYAQMFATFVWGSHADTLTCVFSILST